MGLSAEILAIGPFAKTIVPYLEYPAETYDNTKEGTNIVEHLFGIYEGSSLSRIFADLLGVKDVWDFNQHKLDPTNFDKTKLSKFTETYDDYEKDLEALLAFAEHGFDLYFLPNG